MKFYHLVISLLLMTGIVAAQETPATFTIDAAAFVGGTISPSGSISVTVGSDQTFTISPDNGYKTDNVMVNGTMVGAVSSWTFYDVQADESIRAFFNKTGWTINASAGTGGSISPSGLVSVDDGGEITFNIAPDENYGIDNVYVDGTAVGAVTSWTFYDVTENHTINAQFHINGFTITATASSGGTIDPMGDVHVAKDDDQTFTMTPDPGWQISELYIDGSRVGSYNPDGDTWTFSAVDGNHSISVYFSENTYTITPVIEPFDGGVVNPFGMQTVKEGESITFTFTPADGYKVKQVIVTNDDQGYEDNLGAVESYTFANVNANHTLKVTFEIITYTITPISDPVEGGIINPIGMQTVNHGASITFNFTPSEGYRIKEVIVSNDDLGFSDNLGPVENHTFVNVQANYTLMVNFELTDQIDLAVTDIIFTYNEGFNDGRLSISKCFQGLIWAVVENMGNVDITSTTNIKWYLDGKEVGYSSIGATPAGTVVPQPDGDYNPNIGGPYLAFLYDQLLSPGIHTLEYFVDCDNHLDEVDETNNRFSKTFEIVSTNCPDIVIDDITLEPNFGYDGDYLLIPIDSTVSCTEKVVNQGDRVANDCIIEGCESTRRIMAHWSFDNNDPIVAFYWDDTPPGSPVLRLPVPGVQIGYGQNLPQEMLELGTHELKLELDMHNIIRESNENNNSFLLKYKVIELSDIDEGCPEVKITEEQNAPDQVWIELSWPSSAGADWKVVRREASATSYQVLGNGQNSGNQIVYQDKIVQIGKRYFYALMQQGSYAVCQEFPENGFYVRPPFSEKELNFHGEVIDGIAALKWNPRDDSRGWIVRRARSSIENPGTYIDPESPFQTVNIADDELVNGTYTFYDQTVESGFFYSYWIKRYNPILSDEENATQPKAGPVKLQISSGLDLDCHIIAFTAQEDGEADDAFVTLNWNGFPEVTGWSIQRWSGETTDDMDIIHTVEVGEGEDSFTYDDHNVTRNLAYHYELLAHSDALQQSSSCGPVDITLGGAPAVCQSFTALISAVDDNSYTIDFKWNNAPPTSAWDIMLENPDGSLEKINQATLYADIDGSGMFAFTRIFQPGEVLTFRLLSADDGTSNCPRELLIPEEDCIPVIIRKQ